MRLIAKPLVAIALALALGAFRCSPPPPAFEPSINCGPKVPARDCPK